MALNIVLIQSVKRIGALGVLVGLIGLLAATPPQTQEDQGDSSCKSTYPATSEYKAGFFDLIDGGTCWACPSNTTRSAASVKANNACVGYTTATLQGKYGCKPKYGSSAFKDAGTGKCYACPSGYIRTATGIKSDKACAKNLITGPFKPATYKGSPDCDKGFKDPIDGGTCWTCPSNSKRTVFSVKSDQACEVQKEALLLGKYVGFKKMSQAAQKNITGLTENFMNSNSAVMTQVNDAFKLVTGKFKNTLNAKSLTQAVKSGDYNSVWNQIKGDMVPILKSIQKIQANQAANLKKFTVLSLSYSSSGAAVIGGGVTQGILVYFHDLNNIELRGFTSYGASSGTSAGIGSGVSLGILKNDRKNGVNGLDCGAGFSVTVAAGLGKTAEVAGTVDINPQFACNGNLEGALSLDAIEGLSISASAGVGAPIPASVTASFSSTVLYKGISKDCKACGGSGQDACSLTERIPSCNKGLREQCGKCM